MDEQPAGYRTAASARSSRSHSISSEHEPAPSPLPLDAGSRSPQTTRDEEALKDALEALDILRSGSTQSSHSSHLSDVSGPFDSPSFSSSSSFPSTVPHDASRSASTASTASGSWPTSAHTSSTGASSPADSDFLVAASDVEFVDGDDDDSSTPVEQVHVQVETDPNFISRVAQLPLVSGGLDLYQRSKASSRVVKYGAGLVESSLSTISRPLANNLQLGQLDDFACRQLDRFGPASSTSNSPGATAARQAGAPRASSRGAGEDYRMSDGDDYSAQSGTGARRYSNGSSSTERTQGAQAVAVAASRSRWQTMLMEAGGLGAAVSEESLKSLRYCLQWLVYASAHLDYQISILRDFISSFRSPDGGTNALVTASASAHLAQIKHDVVETIRKVVDVVSKYAGAALPEQAKRYVRQSILSLPMKWTSAIEEASRDHRGTSSSASTPTGERMGDAGYFERRATYDTQPANGAGQPREGAERLLTFAVESLDMLRSVTQIFGESVEKAEAWIERLRVVGLDRQRARRDAGDSGPRPPADDHPSGTKRRRPVAEGTSTGVEHGPSTDGEDGVVRRKKGTRSREPTMGGSGIA